MFTPPDVAERVPTFLTKMEVYRVKLEETHKVTIAILFQYFLVYSTPGSVSMSIGSFTPGICLWVGFFAWNN